MITIIRPLPLLALVGALAAVVLAFWLAGPSRASVGSTAAGMPKSSWRLALTSNREGDSEIYSMGADGSSASAPAHGRSGFDGAGPWSPDGRKLLYYRNQGGVWVMNADGSGKRNLTPNNGFNAPGSWSPNGRQVVFTTDRDGNNEVYVMNADGSKQRSLSAEPLHPGVRGQLVARRADDPLLDRPRRQLGALRHGRGRKRPAQPDAERRPRRPRRRGPLVARRAQDRVRRRIATRTARSTS